jgi:hypothetical protein
MPRAALKKDKWTLNEAFDPGSETPSWTFFGGIG